MLFSASGVVWIISIASVKTTLIGVGNLHFSGLVVPLTASSDNEAAPSQYQILLASESSTSLPSFFSRIPAKTPAEYVLTRTYGFLFCFFSWVIILPLYSILLS